MRPVRFSLVGDHGLKAVKRVESEPVNCVTLALLGALQTAQGTLSYSAGPDRYLFQWQTEARACQPEWPSFRHDQQGSGNYNHDGTPPNAAAHITLTSLGGGSYHLTFTAPGDDGSCGTPAAYLTRVNGKLVDLGLPSPVAGGSTFSANVTLAAGTRRLEIQAHDEAGNLGPNTGIAVR